MHALWQILEKAPRGKRLFHKISAAQALDSLRYVLAILKVKDADKYRCHDIRRGHALDLQASGHERASRHICRSA